MIDINERSMLVNKETPRNEEDQGTDIDMDLGDNLEDDEPEDLSSWELEEDLEQ